MKHTWLSVIVLIVGVVLSVVPVSAAVPDPDSPVPPGSKFVVLDLKPRILDLKLLILDLQFKAEPVLGKVQALEMKESATEIRIEMPADVLFDFDKADLRSEAVPVLAQAADSIRRYGRGEVTIEGHTDAKGSDDYNQRLSERRAEAVKRWLQEQGGLKGLSLQTRGWGAKKPIAPNTKPDGSDDPQGRQKNRRVEIIIAKAARK